MSEKQRQSEQSIIRIGLLGLGTVGGGVYKTVENHRDVIRERTGRDIEITRILVRDLEKERLLDVDTALLTLQPEELLGDETIDVFIEVMGGIEPARTIIREALASGRHVITANKELLAKHGAELLQVAEENGVHLLFEASVAGGIPIIRMLQGYLTANRVKGISGILNGTSNFILTEMGRTGREYGDILEEAQRLGYAEADPTSDVEGYDAAYKLAILTNLAYEGQVGTERIERQGITGLHPSDLQAAESWGYSIKLIAHSSVTESGVRLSVRPRLLPQQHPLARVDDVFNAVTVQADVVGDLTFIGRGAGEFPTASAVVEDLTALLTGETAIRRPSWHRALVHAEPSQGAGPNGLYVSFASSEEQAGELASRLERAVAGAGGWVGRRLTLSQGGLLKQAWLLGGVEENLVHRMLVLAGETDQFDCSVLFLPVEGEVSPGVEWVTTGTSCPEETRLFDPQAL
jgi:homoserine dehydrogenase